MAEGDNPAAAILPATAAMPPPPARWPGFAPPRPVATTPAAKGRGGGKRPANRSRKQADSSTRPVKVSKEAAAARGHDSQPVRPAASFGSHTSIPQPPPPPPPAVEEDVATPTATATNMFDEMSQSSRRKRNITRQHTIRHRRGNTGKTPSRFHNLVAAQPPPTPPRAVGNGESRRGEEEEEEEEKRRRGGRLLRPRRLPHPPRGRRANHRAEPARLLLRRRSPPAPPSLPLAPCAGALPSPSVPRRAPAAPPLLQLAFRGRAELRGDGRGGAAVHGGRRDAGVRRRGRQWLGAGAGEWQPASGRGCLQCRDGSVSVSGWQGTSLGLPCSAEAIVESISGAVGSGSTGCQVRVSWPSKCLYLIIDTVVLMVNSCKVDKLHNLQQELVRKVTHLLREVWSQVRLLRSSADCSNGKDQLQSRPYEISEAIFRLSMDLAYPAHVEPDEVRKSFFGQTESDFEKFALMYWENSPYLYRKKQSDLEGDAVFTSLNNAFDLRTPDAIIESFIQGLVSCPAIASDELNINLFLHEVHDCLGAPVKYRQDVRVVRTPEQTSTGSGIEEHFFNDGMVFPDGTAFVEQCKDAIKNGFSIALRGMEFRSEKIADIASALADLFGQPSVGANIYFSPPRSQGLARHYDDHCVLVWQLLGRKKWKIWPNTKSILPRLYEPFHSLDGLVDDSGGRVEVLHEGDIMYVPRGHVHEAHTDVDEGESEVNASTNYSLHLTLAIEVEPPFEWEGFAHIALHCWLEEQELVRSPGSDQSKLEEQAPLFALLLHVAIRLLSNSDPSLRKACMVAAKLPSSSNSLRSSHRSTFAQILHNINRNCGFEDALGLIELTVKERNDEPFQWMSWLRHLPQQQQQHGRSRIDFCDVLGPLEELLDMFSSDRERASANFAEFRSRFCRRAEYEDARREFEALLRMYRAARTRYAKGMLALHGKHGC